MGVWTLIKHGRKTKHNIFLGLQNQPITWQHWWACQQPWTRYLLNIAWQLDGLHQNVLEKFLAWLQNGRKLDALNFAEIWRDFLRLLTPGQTAVGTSLLTRQCFSTETCSSFGSPSYGREENMKVYWVWINTTFKKKRHSWQSCKLGKNLFKLIAFKLPVLPNWRLLPAGSENWNWVKLLIQMFLCSIRCET